VPTVRIEGQVKRPGYVDYAPGRTLSEYVELAGGFTERSARSSRARVALADRPDHSRDEHQERAPR
jgi:protein involved in polysaccharide export with SLBB domain